ncbi:MAG: hypothetical protein AABW80_03305 [Nanoarchaeota archaeon]
MVETIFSGPIGQAVLVFILVFTLVFAVLQKAKIFGEGKKQSDVLVALAVALLTITVGSAMDLITRLVPFLASALVVILVFLLLLGFFYKEFDAPSWMKNTAAVLALLAVVIAVVYFTGAWEYLYFLTFDASSNIVGNIVLVIVIVVAILFAWFGKGKGNDK